MKTRKPSEDFWILGAMGSVRLSRIVHEVGLSFYEVSDELGQTPASNERKSTSNKVGEMIQGEMIQSRSI